MQPTRRCVLVFVGGIPVALVATLISAQLWTLWLAYLGLAVLLSGVDAMLGLPRRRLSVAADAPDVLYIGESGVLEIALRAGRAAGPFEMLTHLGPGLREPPPITVAIPEKGELRVPVELVPTRRGVVKVVAVWLRWAGPLGLVQRQKRQPLGLTVDVVPNIKAVRQTALRFFSAREFLAGLKVERYVGDGSEFESMREYVPGLDHRAMNWKVSARHRKLICEEFRAERNHQVVLALDSGHLMADPLDGIPKIDHAINAGLLLSYVCLRTGDRVGWVVFDQEVRSYTAPGSGTATFRRLQRQSAEIRYSRGETNFTLGLMDLSKRLTRRSMVVVLTDFVDTVTAELMIENLARLARRHLVLFVTLRDPELDDTVLAGPETLDHLYRSVVARDIVGERDVVLRRLGRLGIQVLDIAPKRITTELLNRYLEVKRRELF